MSPHATDWLSLVLRWAHVIAGITWIGHALFFNWLDGSVDEVDDDEIEGELWMVHSGGFYRVQKHLRVSKSILDRMHWFKWEAAFTWITGFFLLGVVYYLGGAALTIPQGSDLSTGKALLIGVGSLFGAYVIYDIMWRTLPAKVAAGLSVAGLFGAAYGLNQVFTGRAAYLHTGAIMGTCMVANVWMRIIPAQRQLVAAVRAGERPDHATAKAASMRSKHNNYMTYPLIFIMISNHYFHTFGAERAWLVLALIMIAGASVRRIMNLRGGFSAPFAIAGVAAAAAAIYMTAPEEQPGASTARKPRTVEPAPGAAAIDPATTGSIAGVVAFAGDAPERKELSVVSECAAQRSGPVLSEDVVVNDGKLQNVFVWVEDDFADWIIPEPTGEVVIDQSGCVYHPHVLGARAGQPVAITNSDPLLHNVHGIATDNAGFNLAMPTRGTKLERVFYDAEVGVHLKCDVHPWMSAYIGVVDHPFFAVTDAAGAFAIDGLPPGTYTLAAWHETLGEQRVEVTVTTGARATANFELAAD